MAVALLIDTAGGSNFAGNNLRNVATLHVGGATLASSTLQVTGTFRVSGAVTLDTALTTTSGGTGLSSYTAGDLLYYAAGTAISRLAIGAANRVLTSSGSAPQWVDSLTLGGTLSAGTGTFSSSVRVGSNFAATGAVRLDNGGQISWRNAADTADIIGIRVRNDDIVSIGDDGFLVASGGIITSASNANLVGNVTIGANAASARSLIINTAVANTRDIRWQTASVLRWILRANSTAESGSGAGSDMQLFAYNDAGNSSILVYTITRSTGAFVFSTAVHMATTLAVTGAVTLSSTLGAGATTVTTLTATGATVLGSTLNVSGAVTASSTISVSGIATFSNAVTIVGDLTVGSDAGSNRAINIKGAAGSARSIYWLTANSQRWRLVATSTAESGGNAGSNLTLYRHDDAGVQIAAVVTFARDTGLVSFSNDVAITGGLTTSSTTITGTLAISGITTFSNFIRTVDGSAATPAITPSSDTDTGMYRIAANQLGFAVGGVGVLAITSSGITVTGNVSVTSTLSVSDIATFSAPLRAADGTLGAPSYSFVSDPNTGIYLAAPNTIGFSAGGTQRLSVTSVVAVNGSFTVSSTATVTGAATFSSTVTINNTTRVTAGVLRVPAGSAAAPGLAFDTDTDTGIYRVGTNALGITVGNTTVISVATTGVTITGTASVSDTFTAVGATTLSTLSTSGLATLQSASITTTLTVGSTLGVTGATTLSTVSTSGLATLQSVSVTTTLGVSGAVTLSSTLAAGNTTITGTLAVSSNATITGNMSVGNTGISGGLTVARVRGAVELALGGATSDPTIRLGSDGLSATMSLGFFNTAPILRQDVSGATADAALTSLLAALASYGLIVDNTTF